MTTALAKEVGDIFCFINPGRRMWSGSREELAREFGEEAELEAVFTRIIAGGMDERGWNPGADRTGSDNAGSR